MTPPARCRAALLATLLCSSSLPLPAEARQRQPSRLVEDVVLSTETPLGEASITLPADAEVTDFAEEGDSVRLRRGPFVATIPRAQLASGAVLAAAPESVPAPTPQPVRDANAAGETSAPPGDNFPGEWKTHLPVAAAVVLGIYSVFTTLAVWRLRRSGAKEPAAEHPALPAVVTGDGNSIACPLCGKDIAVKRLVNGRNECPVCHGTFVVERP